MEIRGRGRRRSGTTLRPLQYFPNTAATLSCQTLGLQLLLTQIPFPIDSHGPLLCEGVRSSTCRKCSMPGQDSIRILSPFGSSIGDLADSSVSESIRQPQTASDHSQRAKCIWSVRLPASSLSSLKPNVPRCTLEGHASSQTGQDRTGAATVSKVPIAAVGLIMTTVRFRVKN